MYPSAATLYTHILTAEPLDDAVFHHRPLPGNLYELLQQPTGNGDLTTTHTGTQLRSESKRKSIKAKRGNRRALYLDEGQVHTVWKPKRFARKVHVAVGVSTAMLEIEKHRQDLHERQQKLVSRVQATREVLKVQREELANIDEDEVERDEWMMNGCSEAGRRAMDRRRWRNVVTRVMEDERDGSTRRERGNRKKRSMYFHNTVSQYVAAMTRQPLQTETAVPVDHIKKRAPSSHSLKLTPLRTGVMPLRQWRSLVFEDHHRVAANQTEPNHTDHDYEGPNTTGDSAGEFDTEWPTASEVDLTAEKTGTSFTTQLSLGPDIP